MLRPIDDLPRGAVGFVAHGRVTDADRRTVLEPTIEWAIEASGKVRLLYVAASDFDRIAFVAEDGPYARSVEALDGLMPATLRVFRTVDIGDAKAWLAR
jgi:hypothetical protein